jgi:hypothetical protein
MKKPLDRQKLLMAAAVALGAAKPQSIWSDKQPSGSARRALRKLWAAMTPHERRLVVSAWAA